MYDQFVPATSEIRDRFAQGLTEVGGTVIDVYDDGSRLFVRSVLPIRQEILPGDQLQAGIALKAAAEELSVHPYVFRQVCRNGAIVAHALETRRLQRVRASDGSEAAQEVLAELQEAISLCSAEEVFANVTDQMRSATQQPADTMVMTLAFLSHWPPQTRKYVVDQVLARQEQDGDRSQYGLMNAVTSVARDTPDPEMRWRLEELGGAIGASLLAPCDPDMAGAALLRA
jgi:hypothetical protein